MRKSMPEVLVELLASLFWLTWRGRRPESSAERVGEQLREVDRSGLEGVGGAIQQRLLLEHVVTVQDQAAPREAVQRRRMHLLVAMVADIVPAVVICRASVIFECA